MLGLFRPRLPLDTSEKTWVERRLRWLVQQFGIETLRRAPVIVPTAEFFPDAYGGTLDDVRTLMLRVGDWLHLDARCLDVDILPDERMNGAAGLYLEAERLIQVSESTAADPYLLTACLAHELGHELLLGQGRLSNTVADHEWVTDLLPVIFGLGLFTANCTIAESTSRMGAYGYSTIGRTGYLPSRITGYALAHFAWWRGERNPTWAPWLRGDARTAMRQGLRYLEKTRDSVFLNESDLSDFSNVRILERLRSASAGARLDAIWEIDERCIITDAVLQGVLPCITSSDSDLVQGALGVLANWPLRLPATALEVLAQAAQHRDRTCRLMSLLALVAHQAQPADFAVVLRDELRDIAGQTAPMHLLEIMLRLNGIEPDAMHAVVQIWKRALVQGDAAMAELAASVVDRRTPDAREFIRQHFPDRELSRAARESLHAIRADHETDTPSGIPANPEHS